MNNGRIDLNTFMVYVDEISKISKDLSITFQNMEEIVYRLKKLELWTGQTADAYYRRYHNLAESFPIFIINIEKMANQLQLTKESYESLNKKYFIDGGKI